ncbi:hypothetical protein [Jiangella muralis]|uniref:hypothetical protein n=1 Tax=Jiangella muralis TaxID=702383 RepID=UPI00069F0F96|nr:hypothetical protein [Jiangella muralis]
MPSRLCPACTRRYAALVDDHCPVCRGAGTIQLGAAALYRDEPAVVARSIEMYLEAASREAAAVLPPDDPQSSSLGRRYALAEAADELRRAGVIQADPDEISTETRAAMPPSPPSPEGPARRADDAEAAMLTHRTGRTPRPSDRANLDAAPTVYAATDRPLARTLPRVSAAGWPSALAKAADPVDPFGSTGRAALTRISRERRAGIIASAVDRALTIAARRAGGALPA